MMNNREKYSEAMNRVKVSEEMKFKVRQKAQMPDNKNKFILRYAPIAIAAMFLVVIIPIALSIDWTGEVAEDKYIVSRAAGRGEMEFVADTEVGEFDSIYSQGEFSFEDRAYVYSRRIQRDEPNETLSLWMRIRNFFWRR